MIPKLRVENPPFEGTHPGLRAKWVGAVLPIAFALEPHEISRLLGRDIPCYGVLVKVEHGIAELQRMGFHAAAQHYRAQKRSMDGYLIFRGDEIRLIDITAFQFVYTERSTRIIMRLLDQHLRTFDSGSTTK